jgi:hypothetical protein
MIMLDTHIWVWWVHGEMHLPPTHRMYLETHEAEGVWGQYYLLLGSGQVSRVCPAYLAMSNRRMA